MPLIRGKSPESFSKNVSTEMHEGKPLKQSLAIAYAMKKKAKKAHGGEMCAEGCDMDHEHMYAEGGDVGMLKGFWAGNPGKGGGTGTGPKPASDQPETAPYAEGGFVDEEEASGYLAMPEERDGHMYDHAVENQSSKSPMLEDILMKRSKAKGYSEGGRVANDVGMGAAADLEDNQFDDLVKRDDLAFNYTGANSGDEIGDDQEDKDRSDIVAMIMKSRKKKDRMPSPA